MLIPFTDGSYKTAPGQISALARVMPPVAFYAGLTRIVFRCSSQAKHGHYGDEDWASSSHEVMLELEKVGMILEIAGIDNLTGVDGPCVLIGNHMSALETFVLPCIIEPFKDTTFVVKQSLIDYPVFKYIMRSRNPI